MHRNKKKITLVTVILPWLVFVIGVVITYSLFRNFDNSEKRYDEYALKNSVKSYFETQNLQLSNIILRAQQFNELSSYARGIVPIQKNIIKQFVTSTLFERATLIKLTSNGKAEIDLPEYNIINRFKTAKDSLPPQANEEERVYFKKKIKRLIKDGSASTLGLSRIQGVDTIILVIRSTISTKEFLTFSSSLEKFLKDWPSNSRLMGHIHDEQADVELTFVKDQNGKINFLKPEDLQSEEKNKFLNFEKNYFISENFGVSLQAHYMRSAMFSKFVWLIIGFGLFITIISSLFLRFILLQNSRIFDLVVSRTLDLETAMNQAQEANQAKTRFLANMSHELRTPLNSILGMNEVLRLKNTDAKQLEYLKNMQSAGEHLLSLITDLLSVSKEESKELALKNTPIHLKKFFEEIGFIISAECAKKDLIFEIVFGEPLPDFLIGDAVRIKQIALNLLRNSIKYTNKGHINFRISAKTNVLPKNDQLEIKVSDTGIGIPESKVNLIFNRFYQVDGTKALAEGGVGLGLYIVKDLVEKMKGQVAVDSKEGLGSKFTVTLPLQVYTEKAGGLVASNDIQKAKPASTAFLQNRETKINLLVVDDDDGNRELIKAYLLGLDFNITFAMNGKEGLDLFNKNSFDLIVADLRMPIMNGIEMVQEIRKQELANKSNSTPIMLLTADALEETAEKVKQISVDSYLTKPIRREVLLEAMVKLLVKTDT